jgi:hypothetical protein
VRVRKRVFFSFGFYFSLGKVKIGCNWSFEFEWFSYLVIFLCEFSSGHLHSRCKFVKLNYLNFCYV